MRVWSADEQCPVEMVAGKFDPLEAIGKGALEQK